jgi:hypothetical protein
LVDNWNGVVKSRDLVLKMAFRALDDGDDVGAKARFTALAAYGPIA